MTQKQVAVLTLHGMGEIDNQYYAGLERALRKELEFDWNKVLFFPVHYQHIIQENENRVWGAMKRRRSQDLPGDWWWLRKHLMYSFGDPLALEHSGHRGRVLYAQVQRILHAALQACVDEVGEGAPVVVYAHSLGGQVVSNYIWDAQRRINLFEDTPENGDDRDRFLKFGTLRYLFTTGCNIPIFVAGFPEAVCFDFPSPGFEWHNYYDEDDILGWPLSPLEGGYERVRDHVVRVGDVASGWNPMCHTDYWTDKEVVQAVAEKIGGLIS